MVELSTAQMAGIVSLVILISTTGGIFLSNTQKTHYCIAEDNVKECSSLSSTNITCYFVALDGLTKGDRCTNGTWQPIDKFINQTNKNLIENEKIINTTLSEIERLKLYYREPIIDRNKIQYDLQDNCLLRPVVITNAELVKDINDNQYVAGNCEVKIS